MNITRGAVRSTLPVLCEANEIVCADHRAAHNTVGCAFHHANTTLLLLYLSLYMKWTHILVVYTVQTANCRRLLPNLAAMLMLTAH
jgi:hypothetical protein